MKIINRKTLAWTINIALPVTTVVIMFMGYKAYTRLNQMVEDLEKGAQPNYNLIILNEVSFYINEMESNIDSYRTQPSPRFMQSFNEALDESLFLIDSLRTNMTDPDEIKLYDSLSSLVGNWAKVQTQIGALNSDILENTLDDLAEKIEELPELIAKEDTTLEKEEAKKGFIGRLFARKKKLDTIKKPSQSERLQQEILEELANAKTSSNREEKALRNRLASLNEESTRLQNEIVDLMNNLELTELQKDQRNVKNVEEAAASTNQEIIVFSTLSSILLVITIITQLNYLARNRKYQEALRTAKANAEDLAQAKERFLANMSHEIRTPMNAIAGFTNQLLKTDMSAEQRDQLEVVQSSSDHLIHLLNDILDLSKLQANKVELEPELFDVRATLFEVIRVFEEKAKTKNIKLKTEFESVPKYVNGDPHRLRQMVTNLVHNSIKYTEDGSVTLSASIHKKENKTVTLRVSVKDTGEGIPLDKQSKIFEEFEQANTSDQTKGTGLGLAITQMLLKLHGGEIEIDSEPGRGTEISLLIPYEVGKAEKKKKPVQEEEIILKGLKILIADDEPFNLKLLEAIFKNHEVTVISAHDGKQALSALQSENFDLGILDVKMPGLSGFQVVEQIRNSDLENSATPMLALTATISNYERELSKDSGFDLIMRKPFNEPELLKVIEELTSKTSALNGRENGKADNNTDQKKLYDLSNLQSIGDSAFVNEMVETFKQSATKSLVRLNEEVQSENREGIGAEAHKMLPPARHLNAVSLVEALEALKEMSDKSSFQEIRVKLKKIEEIYESIKVELEQVH